MSETDAAGVFTGVLRGSAAARAAGYRAWLAAMLTVEAQLAHAWADAGATTREVADAVEAACVRSGLDVEGLAEAAVVGGNPVIPLVAALDDRLRGSGAAAGAAIGAATGARAYLHRGATSQDILDSAAMVISAAALDAILADLDAVVAHLAGLAARHRDDPAVGRSLLQAAAPTTVGLRIAGWAAGLDTARRQLRHIRAHGLPVQYGGAVGTLAAAGARGPAVRGHLAARLGLAERSLAWHADRTPVAGLAAGLGVVGVAVSKVAGDVVLLAQNEIAEVREASGGGSSTLPHKRNPTAAVLARSHAMRIPGLVATLLSAGAQELERAAGAWHAEWTPLVDILAAAGDAMHQLRRCVTGLVVDTDRAEANLRAAGPGVSSERLAAHLSDALGRRGATAAVAAAVRAGRDDPAAIVAALADAVPADSSAAVLVGSRAALLAMLDPLGYTGEAARLVDEALASMAVPGGPGAGGGAS